MGDLSFLTREWDWGSCIGSGVPVTGPIRDAPGALYFTLRR